MTEEIHRTARQVLGLPEPQRRAGTAAGKLSLSDVRKAYRARALELHPDRLGHHGDGAADSRAFLELQQAYEHLVAQFDLQAASSKRHRLVRTEEFDQKWALQAESLRALAAAQWNKRHPPRNSQRSVGESSSGGGGSSSHADPKVPNPLRADVVEHHEGYTSKKTHPALSFVDLRLLEVIGRNALLRAEEAGTFEIVKALCAVETRGT